MDTPEQPQIYLITPSEFELSTFTEALARVLDAHEIACIRLDLAARNEDRIARAADACREVAYARDCLPQGILGLNVEMFDQYVRNIADRRLERIGLRAPYGTKNPFPWMSETMDLPKEKNFFETRVTDYQSGSVLQW